MLHISDWKSTYNSEYLHSDTAQQNRTVLNLNCKRSYFLSTPNNYSIPLFHNNISTQLQPIQKPIQTSMDGLCLMRGQVYLKVLIESLLSTLLHCPAMSTSHVSGDVFGQKTCIISLDIHSQKSLFVNGCFTTQH